MENELNQETHSLPRHEPGGQIASPASYLAQEYARWQALYQAQPGLVRHFFQTQAGSLAAALIQNLSQARFTFPEQVVVEIPGTGEEAVTANLPPEAREQMVGGLMDRLTRTGLGPAVRQRLDELEASSIAAVSICAGLLRFATATYMVRDRLPSGRSVTYRAADEEEVPTIPVERENELATALTASSDAIAEAAEGEEEGRGELVVPYVPAARRFFLPQWVAFDDQDRLLVSTANQAEAYLSSMQDYLKILHAAVSLAPYMVADEEYRRKRYGMLGQLINQGRALARFETREIIATIQRRAKANDLNRGLSLSLPYFDDQSLEMRTLDFDVIPSGRIMFVPGFVVLAARKEQVKVDQDTRLSRSTRKYLLRELQMLEFAFV